MVRLSRGLPPSPFRATRRRIRTIVNRLERVHGPRPWQIHGDPLGGLIETILSQHTNDANSGAAYDELRRRYPKWDQVLHAPTSDVEDAIRRGGLARQKARRIHDILAQIQSAHGRLELDFLAQWESTAAMEFLCRFKGVGPKTAACVLMFHLGKAVLPVDTHIHRVSRRLGLVPDNTTAEKTQELLGPLCPPEVVYAFHVLVITHGRQTCRSQTPRCQDCPLAQLCPIGSAPRGILAQHRRSRCPR